MKKWHQVAKEALSPFTTTARTLFNNVEDDGGASTQGNSRGEVNVVKVVSEGFHLCGACGKKYGNKKEMKEHMEEHRKENDKLADEVDIVVDEPTFDVDEDMDMATIAEEIENLMIVDTIVDSFVDMAFRAMRPSEASETTKEEDKYILLYRQHVKMLDKNMVLIKANENRLEVLKEMEKLRVVASSSLEDLQETKQTNQILEECVKMKDTEIEAMNETIANLKKKAEDDASKAIEQAKNIRAMEEELGVWDKDEEEEVTELNNEWISDDARRHNKKSN